jgi:ribosomal protein S7
MKLNLFIFKRNTRKSKRDTVFNSLWIYKLINNIKKHTHSTKAERLVYKNFSYLKRYYKINIPLITFKLIKTQKLLFKITKVRIAGRIYQLPISLNEFNTYSTSFRDVLKQLKLQRLSSFTTKFIDLFNNSILIQQNANSKKRQEIYQTLTAYRGYLHYRWRV